MKLILSVLSILILSGCSKPVEQTLIEPQFFFHWDQDKNVGVCKDQQGNLGLNPKYVGPCGDLRGHKLSGDALDGASLRGAMLDGMSLKGFSMNGTDFTGAFARGATFDDAKMNGAKLTHGHFEGSTFLGTELNGASAEGAHLSGARLKGASLFGADMTNSDIAGAQLPKGLHTTKLRKAMISFGTQLPFDQKMAKRRGLRDNASPEVAKASEADSRNLSSEDSQSVDVEEEDNFSD